MEIHFVIHNRHRNRVQCFSRTHRIKQRHIPTSSTWLSRLQISKWLHLCISATSSCNCTEPILRLCCSSFARRQFTVSWSAQIWLIAFYIYTILICTTTVPCGCGGGCDVMRISKFRSCWGVGVIKTIEEVAVHFYWSHFQLISAHVNHHHLTISKLGSVVGIAGDFNDDLLLNNFLFSFCRGLKAKNGKIPLWNWIIEVSGKVYVNIINVRQFIYMLATK